MHQDPSSPDARRPAGRRGSRPRRAALSVPILGLGLIIVGPATSAAALDLSLFTWTDTNGDQAGDYGTLDTDGDGDADLLARDLDFDGRHDYTGLDLDGDGWFLDRALKDTDGDGHLETLTFDLNENGKPEFTQLDLDGDGDGEVSGHDQNENGRYEMVYADWDNNGALELVFLDRDENGVSELLAPLPTRPPGVLPPAGGTGSWSTPIGQPPSGAWHY